MGLGLGSGPTATGRLQMIQPVKMGYQQHNICMVVFLDILSISVNVYLYVLRSFT